MLLIPTGITTYAIVFLLINGLNEHDRDIIMLLKKHDLSKSTVAEIRKNEAVHDAVYAYAKKNDIKMGVIWKLLGIKNAYDLKSEQKLV